MNSWIFGTWSRYTKRSEVEKNGSVSDRRANRLNSLMVESQIGEESIVQGDDVLDIVIVKVDLPIILEHGASLFSPSLSVEQHTGNFAVPQTK